MPAAAQPKTNGVAKPANGAVPGNLVEILVSTGVIKPDLAESIKVQELQTGKSQEQLLADNGTVSEDQITRARATLYNIPYVDLDNTPISPEALSTLHQDIATKFKLIPISIDTEKNILSVAMGNPLDLGQISFLEQKTGMRIKPLSAPPSKIEKLISERYTMGLSDEVSEAIKETAGSGVMTVDLSHPDGVIADDSSVSKIVRELLSFAVKSRSSDVHIEPEEKNTRIRYRIDGILQEKYTMPRGFHDALISRIKILGGMKIDEKRVPQDGRFNFKSGLDEVDLRVSSLPTVHGEKIVMRLLKKSGGVPDLPDLGLRGTALKNVQEAFARPHGIILICGPTGSGKTTTLYSILSRINTPKVNILTLEDPVEYQMPGVNQVQVNPDAGLTFASGLRSFLRQDPNIIMVGEIRDAETATLAVQAALTGHLVFSTLHTNDASGALPRLVDMGLEPFLLVSSITAIVAQRVVRRIHEPCRQEYAPPPEIEKDIKDVLGKLLPEGKQTKLYKGKGDSECGNSGYSGRVGIYEVMPISEKIGRLALEHQPAGAIQKQAEEEGMITMKQDGYLKALEGITSLEEVLRVAQE